MPQQNRSTSPYAALLAAQVFFGSTPVIGKFVLQAVPPVALVGFRVVITAVVVAAFQIYRRRFWLVNANDYWRFAVLSLFGVTFNQLLFITGLSLTTASNTSLLAVTIPVFALTTGAVIRAERLDRRKLIGIALAALGVLLIIDPRKASFSSATTRGDLLVVLNSLSYGIYIAISKPVITRNGVFRSIMWVFIFGMVFCAPLGAWSLSSIDVGAVEPSIWLVIIYIALGSTAAPYLLNAFALARVPASTVAVFVYLQPIIGFLLAVVFLGEQIGALFMLAAFLIFAGVFLVSKNFRNKET
jgi:drug/metabolite transporter (DMT)-like permease